MEPINVSFGYYPQHLALRSGPVSIGSLPDLDHVVSDLMASERIEGDWIYAPRQEVRHLPSGSIHARPYPARIFGLPKTHRIEHAAADSDEHIAFHIWSLSFFTGMRLTSTDAGFVDATPIRPGNLVDFVMLGRALEQSLAVAEDFWRTHRAYPQRSRLIAAAIHAMFLAQRPQQLQFERFMLLYAALDACYALAESMHRPPQKLGYARRIAWMCGLFQAPVPEWADPNVANGPEASIIRNATIHEALFMGAPLGFALHGVGTNQNRSVEMVALTCRFLVGLLAAPHADYIRSPVNTRQRHGLRLM